MATWQFDLSAVQADGSSSLPAAWRFRVEGFLVGLYPASIESDGWTMFGPSDGDRLDLFFDSTGCEVSVRIDARNDDRTFVATVCALMALLGCSLHSSELQETLPAEANSIYDALQRSAAWQFALDPQAFLSTRAGQ
ncbi:MAG: hypothetical protein E6R08_00290 [Nevskiaceae bacterium]|nr:MAG: hypothetical protein E6R08_00290 [Nevskiaceae bacterium]